MTPDSAWRQFRGAVRDLRALHDKLTQCRNVWLQTMLEDFEVRRAAADEKGIDVTKPANLFKIGVPCKDCLTIAGPRTGHEIVLAGAGKQFPVYAECGQGAIDPTVAEMPVPPGLSATAASAAV